MTDPKPMTHAATPLTKEEREKATALARRELPFWRTDSEHGFQLAAMLRYESTLSAKEAECDRTKKTLATVESFLADFEAENKALREAVERLTQDAERLDALEQLRHSVGFLEATGELNHGWWLSGDGREDGPFQSVREAIDAARRPSPEDTKS